MESKPPTNEIRLLSICIKETELRISLELQVSDEVDVRNPDDPRAFYIEYGIQKKKLKLRELIGWEGIQGPVLEPTEIKLIFARFPDEISEFNLLEGTNRPDGYSYWDFIGIKLNH